MIITEDFMKKLKTAFDINEYEVKIWTALLSKGIASAGSIADISGVPRSRAYDVLETLEKKGFVIQRLGKPIMYLAMAPDEVVHRLMASAKKSAESQVKSLEEVKSTDLFKEVQSLYKNGVGHIDVSSLSGYIKGRSNSYAHIEELVKNAKHSVVMVVSGANIHRKQKLLQETFNKLAKKGVSIKIYTQISSQNQDVINALSKVANVRNTDMNGRFILIDGENLLFMTSEDHSIKSAQDDSIWIKSKTFVSTFAKLFETSATKKK